ncbi:hypothetical protein INT46_006099 [Mucor plumbeus]|uniref:C2H2-type domain-containing protein n=1 Tax=Mucor plumbeus TaxID=97098 RepID=A0A8H7QHS3_9FUNG|nr:hypothetical protein INT46_006099 [Mucor plumbeus]
MFTFNPMHYNNNNNNNNNNNIQSSPAMSTPYLDSSNMDTPFLDNFCADTPPFFDTALDISPYLMYASFANNHQQVQNSKDVFIAGYLDGHENSDIAKLTHDPLKFNGDPSVLLIDKSKTPYLSYPSPSTAESKPSPTIKLETVTEEDSDSLFPPLNSSQQSMNTESQLNRDISLDQLLGFDPSSPLSEDDSEDYVEEEPQQQKKDEKPLEQEQPRKRKASDDDTAVISNTFATKKTKTSSAKNGSVAKKPKETKIYHCPMCPHVSKRRYNLTTHIKTHDKNRVKEFDCLHEGCNKSFDRRHDRDRHLATVHQGERSYKCSDCKSHFSRRDALNRHLVQKHDYDENDFAE